MKAPRLALTVGLLVVSMISGGQAAWIQAKAELAQWLMLRSWEQTKDGKEEVRPWPWADTFPVGELTVEKVGEKQLVLAGASGRTLAFGPSHVAGSAPIGQSGNTVIVGHRDTHFSFLHRLSRGDRIHLRTAEGKVVAYRIESIAIVDAGGLKLHRSPPGRHLTLVTCYPFDQLSADTPWRYVIRAAEA